MKIAATSLDRMANAIAPLDTPERRAQYVQGDFRNADRVKDLDKRYRWDLLYAAGLTSFVCDLYDAEGLTDAHIDTALRNTVPALESGVKPQKDAAAA